MKVGLFGANGRMGRVLVEALDLSEDAELSVATVRDDSPWVGLNVGELAGIGKKEVDCTALSDLRGNDADVMIDFTLPSVIEPSPKPFIPYRWVLPLSNNGHILEAIEQKPFELPQEMGLVEIDARAGFEQPARKVHPGH